MTTTTNLNKPRARTWYDLPVPQAAGIAVFCLYLVAALVGQIHAAPTVAPVPTPALPTQSRPVIVIQKEMVIVPPLPTALPPTPQVIYVQLPAPEPQVIYQPVYVEMPQAPAYVEQPAMAVATPEPCYSAERQAMIQGVSIGVGVGTSCVSQEDADRQAADRAFELMNQRMSR